MAEHGKGRLYSLPVPIGKVQAGLNSLRVEFGLLIGTLRRCGLSGQRGKLGIIEKARCRQALCLLPSRDGRPGDRSEETRRLYLVAKGGQCRLHALAVLVRQVHAGLCLLEIPSAFGRFRRRSFPLVTGFLGLSLHGHLS